MLKHPLSIISFLSILNVQCTLADTKTGISLVHQGKIHEAQKAFEDSIQKNDPEACFYSGMLYLNSETPDVEKGLALLEKAVQKDYNPALNSWAGFYLNGDFKDKDPQKALMYYEKAAQRGYGPAQFNCGILYKNGDHIPQNLEKAFYFLTLACQNKNDLADMAQDAEDYRNEVAHMLTKEQYQRALSAFAQNKYS